jgi:hypothetical protein
MIPESLILFPLLELGVAVSRRATADSLDNDEDDAHIPAITDLK